MSTEEKLDQLPYRQFVKKREEQEQERDRDRSMAYMHKSQQVLTELLNLPQSSGPTGKDYAQAIADFDKRYKTRLRGYPAGALSGGFLNAVETYREDRVRGRQEINSLVVAILNERLTGRRGRPDSLGGIRWDIVSENIEYLPRDLLDAVAVKFRDTYKSMARCKRCNRLFIRDYPNERHCSGPCKEEARAIGQREHMQRKRKRAKEAQQKNSAAKSKSRRKQ
jgi:hypothetical protein